MLDRVTQVAAHLTQDPEVPGSIPRLATYLSFSSHFFKKGSCQLLTKDVHLVLVNRFGGLSLPRNYVVRSTDSTDMARAVYHGHKATTQQHLALRL